jgi:hypothetical protein
VKTRCLCMFTYGMFHRVPERGRLRHKSRSQGPEADAPTTSSPSSVHGGKFRTNPSCMKLVSSRLRGTRNPCDANDLLQYSNLRRPSIRLSKYSCCIISDTPHTPYFSPIFLQRSCKYASSVPSSHPIPFATYTFFRPGVEVPQSLSTKSKQTSVTHSHPSYCP